MLKKNAPNTSKPIWEYFKKVFFKKIIWWVEEKRTWWFTFMFFYRPLVTQLAAPKIPEGERVDFDVCCFKIVLVEQVHDYSIQNSIN